MAQPVAESGGAVNITGTGNVTAAPTTAITATGHLLGFYVNSTTGGTLVLRSGGSGGTVMSGTITPAIGWHSFPADFQFPLHATIANTLNVTLFFNV